MLFTDIRELKSQLDIDPNDLSEDKNLNFFVEYASQWICEILNRPDFSYKLRTEYYKGTNTPKLLLRYRPVYITPTPPIVNYDEFGYFGTSPGAFTTNPTVQNLVFGQDYTLQIDQPDGSSRSGILIRINNSWERPYYRQAGLLSPFVGEDVGSFKVQYQAGYTVDNLPPVFRLACIALVAKLRYFMPLGVAMQSERYEERNIAMIEERKDYLLALIKPMIINYRNWVF